jgi:hypothetical protein
MNEERARLTGELMALVLNVFKKKKKWFLEREEKSQTNNVALNLKEVEKE